MRMSDSGDFLQERRDHNVRVYRRVRTICIIVCVLWIPIALFVYKPSFLFREDAVSGAVSDDVFAGEEMPVNSV